LIQYFIKILSLKLIFSVNSLQDYEIRSYEIRFRKTYGSCVVVMMSTLLN